MIYIDSPIKWKKESKKKYFHIIADTLDELHDFAQLIALKRCWFETSAAGWKHYDAPEEYYYSALMSGAILLDRNKFIDKCKEIKENETERKNISNNISSGRRSSAL